MTEPYISLYDNLGSIEVWLVDGSYVRKNLDPNFTDFGEHYHYSFIPMNKFWLDKDTDEAERGFFVDNLLVQHRLMGQGVGYEQALTAGDKAEQAERKRADPTGQTDDCADVARSRLFLWGATGYDNLPVWVVDASVIHQTCDDNFVEGGHDLVYSYIKSPQVWIEKAIYNDPAERGFDLLHELYERHQMARYDTPYKVAHRQALALEHKCREQPQLLRGELLNFGWGRL